VEEIPYSHSKEEGTRDQVLPSKGRGWGQGGEMNQALYAHMNNKRKMKKK
jgi:hypothetical protein